MFTASYNCVATANSPAGTYTIIPSIVASANYTTLYTNGVLQVLPALPAVTWLSPTPIVLGTTLSSTQLNATANIPGAFVYTPESGVALKTGTNRLQTVFTPADNINYLKTTNGVDLYVYETNQTPVLEPVPIVYVNENSPLNLQIHATDKDFPAQSLAYSFDSMPPTGMSINAVNGLISWMPTEAQGPSTNKIAVRVEDTGTPVKFATQEITIVVVEINEPPFISAIQDNSTYDGLQARQSFVIGDAETAPDGLILKTASSDTNLVPLSAMQITGTGSNRVLTISPLTNRIGLALITVTVMDPQGAQTNTSFNILVQPVAPSIVADLTNQTIVQGHSASFQVEVAGTAPFNYQWQFGSSILTGQTNKTLLLTNVIPDQSGVYSVQVGNAGGSVASMAAVLAVLIPPRITSQPTNQIAVAGNTALFRATASGTEPLAYQWWFNETNQLAGATNRIWAVINISQALAGSYQVQVTNSAGSVTSAVARLTVLNPLVITSNPANAVVIVGNNSIFRVAASGSAPIFCQWLYNGAPIAGATNQTMSLTNIQPWQAGSYSAVLSNAAGSQQSSSASLTVNIPPSITRQPVSLEVLVGSGAQFSIAAEGSAPLWYQWWFKNTPVAQGTSFSIQLTNAQTAMNGDYQVVITNVAGSVTSSPVQLNVLTPPVLVESPASQSIVTGQKLSLRVIATSALAMSYQWQFNGLSIANETNSTLIRNNVQPDQAGKYRVTAMNAAGQFTTPNAVVIVLEPVIITKQPESQTNRLSENATFLAEASGTQPISYQWYHTNQIMPGITNSSLTFSNIALCGFRGIQIDRQQYCE